MSIPTKILGKILGRFDGLIEEGIAILDAGENVPATYCRDGYGGSSIQTHAYKKLSWPRYVEWRTNTATLLCHVLPKDSVHRKTGEKLHELSPTAEHIEWAISFIKAIKNDLEGGFLDGLASHIEAEIVSDYLGQAERLIGEGRSGKYEHVPAAVLCGAVLEKALKKLCAERSPAVSLVANNGSPKTMNPLIDDLKTSGLFNELKAKQLRAWADIRNKAAHGDFDQFNREDVEQMLQGVSRFLAEHLT